MPNFGTTRQGTAGGNKKKRGVTMPQTNCIDCGQPISSNAKVCPHCGRIKEPTKDTYWREHYRKAGRLLVRGAIAFLILGLVAGVWAAFQYKLIIIDGFDEKTVANWLLAITIFGAFIFPSSVCYGLGKLLCAKADL